MFINLHGYSTFSFLEAIGKPKDIVAKAKDYGQTAIALTDLNVVYGALQLYQAAQEAQIKPIVGTEIGFVLDIHNSATSLKAIGSLCLLAISAEGYQNLLKLVSYASQEGISLRPKIDPQILQAHKGGLLAFCGGVESRIGKMLANGEALSKIEEILLMLREIFGEDKLYLEIIAQNEKENPDIAKVNHAVLQLHSLTGIPCIISNIYAYPDAKDKQTQELAMAIKDNLKLYDPQHRTLSTANHIMHEEEIRAIGIANGYSLAQLDEWIGNTAKIAADSDLKIATGQALFPKYIGSEEIQALYQNYQDELVLEEAS